MKIRTLIFMVAASVILSGCQVGVSIDNASISRADLDHQDVYQENMVKYYVTVDIKRDNLKRISDNQLYFYIHILNCRTDDILGVALPYIGSESISFDYIDTVLTKTAAHSFTLEGAFDAPPNLLEQKLCVTLDGGSYLLTKISSNTVPAEINSESR